MILLYILCFSAVSYSLTENIQRSPVIWAGSTGNSYVALTFDDGPKPEYCIPILDVLDKYDVKATFFIIGREARWHPDLVHRIVQSGHDLGNHTYSHFRLDSLSREQVYTELKATNEIIFSIIGMRPLYFRPPGGRFNGMVLEEVQKNNMIVINWTLNAGDYTVASKYFKNLKQAKDIESKIVNNCKNGDIILMHNGGGPTIESLPNIIIKLKEKGFTFVTVSDLLKLQT